MRTINRSPASTLRNAYHSSLSMVRAYTRSLLVRHNRAHISSAQNLPMEILEKIFIKCNQRDPDSPVIYLHPIHGSYYPWKLGQIFSHWREALWRSSEVWNTIYLKGIHREQAVWDLLDHILSRTTGLITIYISPYLYDKGRLMSLLSSSCYRFRSLSVESLSHEQTDELFGLLEGSFKHLEALHILSVYPGYSIHTALHHSPPQPHLLFESLRELVFSGNCTIRPYLSHFPLWQLTSLALRGCMVTPSTAHYILQQCTSLLLADLAIGDVIPGDSGREANGHITSPVKVLTLKLNFTVNWDAFLNPLSFPSLTTFTSFESSSRPANICPAFPRAMLSLITRSNCSLESLSFASHSRRFIKTDSPGPELTGLLQRIPNLETLVLTGPIIGPVLVHTFRELLPQLKNINWKVEPEGLSVFLNLLDDYISRPSLSRFPADVNIICEHGDGIASVRTRYAQSYNVYRNAGIDITVRESQGSDMHRVY